MLCNTLRSTMATNIFVVLWPLQGTIEILILSIQHLALRLNWGISIKVVLCVSTVNNKSATTKKSALCHSAIISTKPRISQGHILHLMDAFSIRAMVDCGFPCQVITHELQGISHWEVAKLQIQLYFVIFRIYCRECSINRIFVYGP